MSDKKTKMKAATPTPKKEYEPYDSKDEARPLAASLLARATEVATLTHVEGKTPLTVILEALYA
jgi:hypothetical protein